MTLDYINNLTSPTRGMVNDKNTNVIILEQTNIKTPLDLITSFKKISEENNFDIDIVETIKNIASMSYIDIINNMTQKLQENSFYLYIKNVNDIESEFSHIKKLFVEINNLTLKYLNINSLIKRINNG